MYIYGMSSETRRAVASFFTVETLDSSLPRVEIRKAYVNAGSRCDGLSSDEDKVVTFSELYPPEKQIANSDEECSFHTSGF